MYTRQFLPLVAISLTIFLFTVNAFAQLDWAWGVNHLRFLPVIYTYICLAMIAVGLLVAAGAARADKLLTIVESLFFKRGIIPRLVFIVACILLFFFFRQETHLLGDGYTLLSNLKSDQGYIQKWTEFGSIELIRLVQRLLGAYTYETARAAFQILSFISGVVVISNIFWIVRFLGRGARFRILGLSTFLFSATALLFFGYVEFYPVLWAIGTSFFALSFKYLRDHDRRYMILALAAFCLGVFMHLQVICLLGSVLWLLLHRQFLKDGRLSLSKAQKLFVTSVPLVVLIVGVYLYINLIEFNLLILPPVTGRPQSPEYAMLSGMHILDMANLLLCLCPGLLVLLAMLLKHRPEIRRHQETTFLLLASVGTLLFLLVIDPVIGLSRDWDLMSFTMLPPVMFVLHRLGHMKSALGARTVVVVSVLMAVMTFSFVSANVKVDPAEERFFSLLLFNGTKDRQGWLLFANYFKERGEMDLSKRLLVEQERLFPSYVLLQQGWQFVAKRALDDAETIARHLCEKDPFRADYLHLLGYVQAHGGRLSEAEQTYKHGLRLKNNFPPLLISLGKLYIEQHRYTDAVEILSTARRYSPGTPQVLEDLGLAYNRLGRLDAASAVADTLLESDRQSACGHLLKLMLAHRLNNFEAARYHFQEYRKYGSNRPEYQTILQQYQHLLQ